MRSIGSLRYSRLMVIVVLAILCIVAPYVLQCKWNIETVLDNSIPMHSLEQRWLLGEGAVVGCNVVRLSCIISGDVITVSVNRSRPYICSVLCHWPRPFLFHKVSVLIQHPDFGLCSADFDKYLPWSLSLYHPSTYPHGYPCQLPGHYTHTLAPRLTNLPSQVKGA